MMLGSCRRGPCVPGMGDLRGLAFVDPAVTDGGVAPTWWQNIISGAFKTTENILTAKTQTKGVLTQTAPGVFTYVQPEGSQVTLPVGTIGVSATASSGMTMLMIGGAALVLVFVLSRKG